MSYALASLVCVGMNLLIQSILVFLGRPASQQVKEQLIVWLLVKPAVDAHRVASNSETVGAVVSARAEMTTIRVVEMVAESLPGTIIQAMAMFSATGDRSPIPVLALSSSVLTSVFLSAQMSHEWDTSGESELGVRCRF